MLPHQEREDWDRRAKTAKRYQMQYYARLSERRKQLKGRTQEIFESLAFDDDQEWLPANKVNQFLSQSIDVPPKKLQPPAVELVVNTAMFHQKQNGSLEPPQEGALHKAELISAVEKYGEYIKNAKKIDEVFYKYDKEEDGYLSRKELLKALQDYERKVDRARPNGLMVRLMVMEEDLDWIMEQSDAEGNDKISHAEYLPAVAAWEELAKMKLEESAATCCGIL